MSWLPSNKSRWTRFKEALANLFPEILFFGGLVVFDVFSGYPWLGALDAVTIGLYLGSPTGPAAPSPSPPSDQWRPSLTSPLVITPSRWTVIVPLALLIAAVTQIVVRQQMHVPMTQIVGTLALMWSWSAWFPFVRGRNIRELRLESDGLWITTSRGRFFIPWSQIANVQRAIQRAGLVLTLTSTEGIDPIARSLRWRPALWRAPEEPEKVVELPLGTFTLDLDGLETLLRRYSLAGQPEPTVAPLPAPFPMVASHE